MIDFTLNPENLGNESVEGARKHQHLIDELNYLIDEGFIEYEEGEDGEIRLFPAS